MTCLRVVTESGSIYELDTEKNTATRTRGGNASVLENDDRQHYFEVLVPPEIGAPLIYSHYMNGWDKARVTTPVVSIEEIPSE